MLNKIQRYTNILADKTACTLRTAIKLKMLFQLDDFCFESNTIKYFNYNESD